MSVTEEMRSVYGNALVALGEENSKIVVLDADVGHSTKSIRFGRVFPHRYFNVGIAELNMASMAAGLSTTGLIPFVNTYAVFLALRAADAVNNLIAQNSLNVKLIASYSGYSIGLEGSSHQSINDIALLRSMPNMTVISVSDNTLLTKSLKTITDYNGPVYLRLSKSYLPQVHSSDLDFKIGKGIEIIPGSDVTIFATGSMVHRALEASELLKEKSISAGVIDIHTIKPIDRELIIQKASKTKAVVTAEEHTIIGGLGSAVSEVLVAHCPVHMEMVGIEDLFAQSGEHFQLMDRYNLTAKKIAEKAVTVLKRKNGGL